jgi:hypothetical protein
MTALQGAAFPDGTTPHYQDLSLNDWRSAPGERRSRRGSDPLPLSLTMRDPSYLIVGATPSIKIRRSGG